MAEEKKIFAGGGMDMDTEERLLRDNDYRYANNCRITSSDEENAGAIENVVGNMILNENLTTQDGTPLTDNSFVVIGSYEDKKLKTFYYFVAEKQGNIASPNPPKHCIVSNLSSNINIPGSFQIIYENPQLKFHAGYPITGVNMIHGEEVARAGLLYWTDDLNPPRKLNVQKAYWWTKSLSTNPILDPEYSYQEEPNLEAIVSPPLSHPKINSFTYTDASGNVVATSGNNYSMASNDIKNTLWQFKYRYIYRDNFKSSWSPISTSATTSFNDASIDDLTISNFIEVVIDTGVQEVLSIELAVRENEDKGDFYLISKIDKDDTLQENILLTSSVGSINTTQISSIVTFDESNNTPLYYIFSNNEPKIPIDLKESIKLFDDVPLLAKAQEIIDGNRLVYGNIVNGYNAISTDTELEVVYQDISAQHGNISPISYSWGSIPGQTCVDSGTFSDDWRKSAEFTMRIHVGDVSSMQSGSLINIAINEVGIAARFMRSSGSLGFCSYKSANRMSKLSLAYTATVNPALTDINDLAALMNANCNILLEHIDYQGGGSMNPRWGLTHSTSGMCEPSSPISTYNGIKNGAFTASGNSIIEFRFMVAHNSELTKTGCNTIEWKVVVGFDGETLWSYDTDNNSAATSSLWPGTINSSSAPIKYAGFYSPNSTSQFTGWVGDKMDYDELWVSTNNSNVIGPMAAAVTNFRGFKSGVRHSFGLVYYDKDNRSGTVNPCSDIYIPFRNERVSGLEDAAASIHFKINHQPPPWADHWQWVWAPHKRGDFIHITVNTIEYDLSISARYRTILPESVEETSGLTMTGYQHLIKPSIQSNGYIKMDMEELIRHSAKAATDTMMWEWAPGDRVRILDITTVGAGGATTPNYAGMDFEIIGVEEEVIGGGAGKFWYILEKAAVGPIILGGNTIDTRIELYRPKKIKGDVYYEFGHVNWCSGSSHSVNRENTEDQLTAPATYMDINNAATPATYHYNQNDAAHPTLPGINPAEGTMRNGDVYLRERVMITAGSVAGGPLPAGGIIVAEDFSFSDYFKSNAWDLGRPNAYLPDFKQTRRHSTIFYSEPIIPNTNINGLGTFYADVSYKEFDKKYNSIQKLFSLNDKLLIFQEDKVSASMVSRAVLFDATGNQNVAISNNVLSSSVPYSGDYGISRNPESFANYGFRSYFVDAKRRAVLRLSMDGLTVISEYKMKNFFTDYFDEVINNGQHIRGKTRIYGAWDDKFDEYVVSHQHIAWTVYDPIYGNTSKKSMLGFTVGFHEPSKKWNSFYSYVGVLAVYNNTLHSFSKGNVYKHNALYDPSLIALSRVPIYNTFYNAEYPSTLEFAFNKFSASTKVYHSITEDSSDIWEVDALYTRNNQLTNITRAEFTNGATYSWEDGHGTKENKHNALIRCDILTPGIALPKIEGDRMRDTSIMCRLSLPLPQALEQNVLFAVGCGYIASTDPSADGNQ